MSHNDENEQDATAELAVQLEGTSLESLSSESTGKISTESNETIEQGTLEPLDVNPTPIGDEEPTNSHSDEENFPHRISPTPIYDDPSDSDDGEGEWITPSNVAIHKSRALDLLPGNELGGKHTKRDQPINSGCMTADFAMQNVLLQMGLNLVGLEGKRIEKVKTWVLRCHACFKYA
jgi:RNA-binding protein NOB1